jgi:hypothetical protein
MVRDVERALSDIAEVRERLARAERFEGYSGPAAAASGIVAIIAGGVQYARVPHPATPAGFSAYLAIWMSCLGVALLLNYGAVVFWLIKNHRPSAQSQFRTAALSIAPSVLLGGALSAALAAHGDYSLLPGTWFAFYAVGLFASRHAIPSGALPVMIAFGVLAVAFVATPLEHLALSWWVVPLGFGLGQLAIGYLLARERSAAHA